MLLETAHVDGERRFGSSGPGGPLCTAAVHTEGFLAAGDTQAVTDARLAGCRPWTNGTMHPQF